MLKKQVTFEITKTCENGTRRISVYPSLQGIYREDGGELIILSIAANCLRMIAKSSGLESAMERFNDILLNHTKLTRE